MRTAKYTTNIFQFALYKQMVLACILMSALFSAQQSDVLFVQEGVNISGEDAITVQIESPIANVIDISTLTNQDVSLVEKSNVISKKANKSLQNGLTEHKNKIAKELGEKVRKIYARQKLATVFSNFSTPVSDEEMANSSLKNSTLFTLPKPGASHWVLANDYYSFVVVQPNFYTTKCNLVEKEAHSRVLSYSLYNRPPPSI